MHARIAEYRVHPEAVIGGDRARHRHLQAAAAGLPADARGLEPLGLAGERPLHQLQAAAARADQAGIEQLPGLDLAGGGAAMLDDDVEAVVGADPGRHLHLGVQGPDIGFDRARGHAGGARRAVEAGADPALDPQGGLVDMDRDLRERERAVDAGRSRREGRSGRGRLSRSSGRATLRSGRRPKVRSTLVPGRISVTTPASRAATWPASALPTPARSSTAAMPSPRPNVARRSMIGRSGLSASASTASVGAIRRPVSPP